MSRKAPVRAHPRVFFSLACGVMFGCASTNHDATPAAPQSVLGDGTAEAASPAETKVLSQLEKLPPGQARSVDTLSVVADPPYAAASGKTCRRLTFTPLKPPKTTTTRLACRSGDDWGFVPSVFLAPTEQ